MSDVSGAAELVDPPLSTALEDATRASSALTLSVAALTTEVRSERLWRKWLVRVLALNMVMVVAAGVYLGLTIESQWSIQHDNHRVLVAIEQATGPAAQQRSATAVRSVIAQVVNETDCRVRIDVADALHAAYPTIAVHMPATTTCAAYTP